MPLKRTKMVNSGDHEVSISPFIKVLIISALSVFFSTNLLIPTDVRAYNPHDYDRLQRTGNCVNCDLSFAKLNKMNLSGSDLRGSDFTNAQLRGANLYKADLFGTILLGADLSYAHWVDGGICKEKSVGYCK